MRTETLTPNPRAGRNDLRAELNALANRSLVRLNGIGLTLDPIVIGVGLADGWRCLMPRAVFDDLTDHEKRFGRVSGVAEDDRLRSGVDLLQDNSWPFCAGCSLPFVTMLNGEPGQGVWVQRIEDGGPLCECCWLAEHYAGDRRKMIEHVLAHDMGDDSRLIRVEIHRGRDLAIITEHLERSAWTSPGLRELIRLHRVSLSECAEVLARTLRDLVRKVKADERERNSTVSKTGRFGASGTRQACYA